MRLRKFWGWGYADEILSDQEELSIEKRILKKKLANQLK